MIKVKWRSKSFNHVSKDGSKLTVTTVFFGNPPLFQIIFGYTKRMWIHCNIDIIMRK